MTNRTLSKIPEEQNIVPFVSNGRLGNEREIPCPKSKVRNTKALVNMNTKFKKKDLGGNASS